MVVNEPVELVHKLLKLCRDNELSNKQRKMLFDIVNNSDRTYRQKERFIKYYNLDSNSQKKYNLTQLGKEYGCTCEAIKGSLHSVIVYTLLDSKITEKLIDILNEK